MAKTLITFLGKSEKNEYPTVSYCFPDESIYEEESSFPLVLYKYLKPEKMVILGTQSSMWHTLFQKEGQTPDEYREQHNHLKHLIEKNERKSITDEQDLNTDSNWQALKDFLAQTYSGMDIGIIGYGQDEKGQIEILKQVSHHVNKQDQLYLDITHGFRHLPMLVVLAALYLQRTKQVEIKAIYYGAYDLWVKSGGDYAPVLDLSGLLKIADWLSAVDQFNKDGDYAVFATLLEQDGLPKKHTTQLEKGAFYERNFNIAAAKQELSGVYKQLDNVQGLSELFTESLKHRLEWHTQGSENPYVRQRNRAEFFLKNRDYVRAALFAREAYITKNMTGNYNNYSERERIRETLTDDNYHKLRMLRNLLVHGSYKEVEKMKPKELRTWQEIQPWIKEEKRLKEELKKLMNALFKSA
ncbi:MAG: TIGR02221 family CRISPR-associated protein [Pseudomonadota bacterium]|nr:TIGR02221 family CRISPR-associated protein [Pseudomonadota bacterium]